MYEPDETWSVEKRNEIQSELANQTTYMFRAPEMLDLYKNYKIDHITDIWSLGCILYMLCFNQHPFEQDDKDKIIRGDFQIPFVEQDFTDFHDLIRKLLL